MKDAVAVITANFNPFRIVMREATDLWSPSLDQINNRTYDYVKLHRLSTYLDVGIHPYSLGVCFDGTLILPANKELSDRNSALSVFNKTLCELLLGGLYCEAVTPDDIGFGSLSFSAYARIHGGGTGPAASFHQAARSKHISTLDAIRLLKPGTVLVEDLLSCLVKGRELIAKLGEIPREQILYGATFFVRKQWAEALIHLWTTTERIVEIAWQRYVVNINGKPAKKRRDFLDDHRTWTVSTRLELLFQKGLLDSEVYENLDTVRKARNDFAHRGNIPTEEIARLALSTMLEFASLCASDFKEKHLFNEANQLIGAQCNSELFPSKNRFETSEVEHWLELPPIPGDSHWEGKDYEIIEELCLKPVGKTSPTNDGSRQAAAP